MTATLDKWLERNIGGGRYKIVSQLGCGGMADVFLAHDQKLDSKVVIKVPRPMLLADPEFAERFRREVRSLVQLSHPHVVKLYDVGEHDGEPFAVMEYLGGGSVEDRPRALLTLRTWLPQICRALDFIHSKGHVHRDVKPGNLLFDENGNAYLSDFGIVKALAESEPTGQRDRALTRIGMVVGTPDYMAPELILGEPYDGRADQYSLAIVLYELLAERRPFAGPTSEAVLVQHTTADPPDLRSGNPAIPMRLACAVRQALAKDPAMRFLNCEMLAAEVLSAMPSSMPPGAIVTVGPPAPRKESGHSGPVAPPAAGTSRHAPSPAGPPPPIEPGGPSAAVPLSTSRSDRAALLASPRTILVLGVIAAALVFLLVTALRRAPEDATPAIASPKASSPRPSIAGPPAHVPDATLVAPDANRPPAPDVTHTETASRPYPSTKLVSRDEFFARARRACPPDTHPECVGCFRAFRDCWFVEASLILAKQRVTEEEYYALVHYFMRKSLGPGGVWAAAPFQDLFEAYVGANVGLEAWLQTQTDNYRTVFQAETDERRPWDQAARDEALAQTRMNAREYSAAEVIASLESYRRHGPSPEYSIDDIVREGRERLARPQPPSPSVGRPRVPQSGDLVSGHGFDKLVPYFWNGKIMSVADGSYRIKITYVTGGPYRKGETYDFTRDDFNLRDRMTLGELLGL